MTATSAPRVTRTMGRMTEDSAAAARRMWRLLEPLHAVAYFASPPIEALQSLGLKGFWMTYFAGRAAPMGAVAAPVVDAVFYNFAPRLVHRAIPDAWALTSPEAVLQARAAGVDRALHHLLGDLSGSAQLGRAVDLLRQAVDGLDCSGRPLAAANAAIPPETGSPFAALWQLATVVREHRGDGHVAALVGTGLDGCQAHVSVVATGSLDRGTLQSARGWQDAEWDAAEQALVERGWLDGAGTATEAGRRARADIEADTDRLASAPWRTLGTSATDELAAMVTPWSEAVWRSGVLPVANPMGLTAHSAT